MYSPEFNHNDVELISRETAFKGFFSLDRLVVKHRLYQGGWSQPFTRELFCRGQAAGVLLHDPARGQVVMVEQFRVGLLDDPAQSPWALELVAGMLDGDESPEAMAMREIHEETGLTVTNLQFICEYYNSPGGSDERISVYYGQVDASLAGGIHGLAEEHENIKVIVMPVTDAVAAIAQGKINNAMAIIALQWLQLHHAHDS